jgi:DNA-binding transcriptional LysR family regulator
MTIRTAQLRNTDLSLLVNFVVLAEERTLSRAARRLFLSQPSMTRALQKLRETFDDALLVRSPSGYVLTPKGENLLQEVVQFLPRLDRLISGREFDPAQESAYFRIAATDNATQLYGPTLSRRSAEWQKTSLSFFPWTDQAPEELEHGRLELVLNAEDGFLPPHLKREILFEDEFVCVVAKDYPLKRRISLNQYVTAKHIGVSVLGGRQTMPETTLANLGMARTCPITVPYFTVAQRMVAASRLVVTMPRRLAQSIIDETRVKLISPPKEFKRFRYLMAWHPRYDTDARSVWLRNLIREATSEIPPLVSDRIRS